MSPRLLVPAVLGTLLAASPTAMALEKPSRRVVERRQALKVGEHAPDLVAETVVGGSCDEAGNAGFRVLAALIFGKNRGEKKFAGRWSEGRPHEHGRCSSS
jgi:hypothetical protein